MITQNLLNFLRDVICNWLLGLPHLPGEVVSIRSFLVAAGPQLNAAVSNWGVVVPWSTFMTCLGIWLALLACWGVVLGVRIVLWALNR